MGIILPARRNDISISIGTPRSLEFACAGHEQSNFIAGPVLTTTTRFQPFPCSIRPNIPVDGPILANVTEERICPLCGKKFYLDISQFAFFDGTVEAAGYISHKRREQKGIIVFSAIILIISLAIISAVYLNYDSKREQIVILGVILSLCFFGIGSIILKSLYNLRVMNVPSYNPTFKITANSLQQWPQEVVPVKGVASVDLLDVTVKESLNVKSSISIRSAKPGEAETLGARHMIYFREKSLPGGSTIPARLTLWLSFDDSSLDATANRTSDGSPKPST